MTFINCWTPDLHKLIEEGAGADQSTTGRKGRWPEQRIRNVWTPALSPSLLSPFSYIRNEPQRRAIHSFCKRDGKLKYEQEQIGSIWDRLFIFGTYYLSLGQIIYLWDSRVWDDWYHDDGADQLSREGVLFNLNSKLRDRNCSNFKIDASCFPLTHPQIHSLYFAFDSCTAWLPTFETSLDFATLFSSSSPSCTTIRYSPFRFRIRSGRQKR